MERIGYIRVSSKDQNTDRQHAAFKAAGIELDRIFEEKLSGKDTKRAALQAMLEYVRENDIVYIESISRLGRSMKDLLEIVDVLDRKKVQLKSLKEAVIDTTTPQGKLIFSVFAALSEFERGCIKERQREGIDAAKAAGKYLGRPKVQMPKGFAAAYDNWKAGNATAAATWRALGLSKSTFYKFVKNFEKKQQTNDEAGKL